MMAALQGGMTCQKGLGAVHSLSHPLGGLKSVRLHHGTINAILLPAVLRYNAPSVLIGYVRQTVPTFWDVRWEIRVGAESFSWRTEGDIVDLVVEDGVDALGDALARRYAVVALSSISDKFALTVLGVKNSGDYTRLLNYLGSLDAVTSLFVRSVDIQSVLIEVSIEGGRSSLAQGISFGSVLAPVEVPPDAYQLLP